MRLFKYFTIEELFTNCSNMEKIQIITKDENFIKLGKLFRFLDHLRDIIGSPIVVTSTFRDFEHNKRVGGVENSQHTLAEAVDFKIKNVNFTDENTYNLITCIIANLNDNAMQLLGQVIIYDTFIHISLKNQTHQNLKFYDKRKKGKN